MNDVRKGLRLLAAERLAALLLISIGIGTLASSWLQPVQASGAGVACFGIIFYFDIWLYK